MLLLKKERTRVKKGGKRSDKGNSTDIGAAILKSKEIIVQPLESEASDKAKKYEHIGPQEFVEFDDNEVTI